MNGGVVLEFLKMKEVKIGAPAPDFELPALDGKTCRLSDYKGKIVVLDWWSAECPASKRYDPWFNEMIDRYGKHGVAFLMIDSNAIYDDDEIKRVAKERRVKFPILRDVGNRVADVYGALTTPHLFVVDRAGILAYEGAIDDQTWNIHVPTKNYLTTVLDALVAGKPAPITASTPFGCTIKRNWPREDEE